MDSTSKVRVRFAPSPTGPLHIGGVRTALFNFLYAKHHKGDFILRIEDTDQGRYVDGAEQYIQDALEWAGISHNEGVGRSGEFGPYRQSERKEIYKAYADQLVHSGLAYYAFDTNEELSLLRKQHESEGKVFLYNSAIRDQLQNSLSLSEEETARRLQSDVSYVIRIKIPTDIEIVMEDIIRGEIHVNSSTLDDKVLFKSDGMPTYHLANIVDDHLMQITHVIRGEEWLPSLPLHYLLYKFLGWENEKPAFAHLPLILKPKGNGKLSKRDGDQHGFPVFPLQWMPGTPEECTGYKEAGYVPEAFINMLALLGWSPGTEQEIFTIDELVREFSLEKVGKSGSKFDPEKAKWFNHQHLQMKTNEELAAMLSELLDQKGINYQREQLPPICGLIKERINFTSDLLTESGCFFVRPVEFDQSFLKKKWNDATPQLITGLKDALQQVDIFNRETVEKKINEYITYAGVGFGQVMAPLRVVLVGSSSGPDLIDIIVICGKEEVTERIDVGLTIIAGYSL